MKKLIWASVIGLSIFIQNTSMAMDEEKDLPKNYSVAAKNVAILYKNFRTPEDLIKIREAAKAALALKPEGQENQYASMLDYCSRFGTGTSRNDFLIFLKNFDELLSDDSTSEQTIHSALIAGLILVPHKVNKADFKCLMSYLEGDKHSSKVLRFLKKFTSF